MTYYIYTILVWVIQFTVPFLTKASKAKIHLKGVLVWLSSDVSHHPSIPFGVRSLAGRAQPGSLDARGWSHLWSAQIVF